MTVEPRKLRVLVLTNMWPSATRPAYGAFVASQVESLAAVGVEASVVYVDGAKGVSAYVGTAGRMIALNRTRDRYDVVHAHTGHCGMLALLQRRYPVVISYVGYDLYGKHRPTGGVTVKSRLELKVFRQLGRFTAATITKSRGLEELLPPTVLRRNTVLPNGVDREVFRPEPRETSRRALGWPEDEVTALFVGSPAVPRKRHQLASESCVVARTKVGHLRLRVCDGVDRHKVALWMNAADVLLLTSVAEGSPNVVKEAAACGLPVVATAVGDVKDVLANVVPSAIVPVSSTADSVAAALVRVLRDGRRSNGPEQTRWLEAGEIARRLRGVYETAAQRRPPLEP